MKATEPIIFFLLFLQSLSRLFHKNFLPELDEWALNAASRVYIEKKKCRLIRESGQRVEKIKFLKLELFLEILKKKKIKLFLVFYSENSKFPSNHAFWIFTTN